MAFPLDAKFIDAVEQKIGAALPDAYRQGMMRSNGGRGDVLGDIWTFHPIFDTSDKKRLKRSANHILRETEARGSYGDLPDGAIEIAKNDFGDALLFLRDGPRFLPGLHLLSHDTGAVSDTGLTIDQVAFA